jgi:protein-tyrosine phosphatase
MQIKIMSREQAKKFCFQKHDEKSLIISIYDPDKEPPNLFMTVQNNVKSILYCSFFDEEKDKNDCITFKQAQTIADAVKSFSDYVELIVVHCEAGISRSAGVAGAIMKFINGDDAEAFSNGRIPNMTCYRRVLEKLME